MLNYVMQYKDLETKKVEYKTYVWENEMIQDLVSTMSDENVEILSLIKVVEGVKALAMGAVVENYSFKVEELYELEKSSELEGGLFFAHTFYNDEDSVMYSSKKKDIVDKFAKDLFLSGFKFHSAYKIDFNENTFTPLDIVSEDFNLKIEERK